MNFSPCVYERGFFPWARTVFEKPHQGTAQHAGVSSTNMIACSRIKRAALCNCGFFFKLRTPSRVLKIINGQAMHHGVE
jgi:hypothetical protein